MAKAINVPERAFPLLRNLSAATDTERGALRKALSGSQDLVSPADLAALLVGAFRSPWLPEQIDALMAEVFAMTELITDYGNTPEETADAVADWPDLELDTTARAALKDSLAALLHSRQVLALARAAALYAEHDRLLVSSRVRIDIRPVSSDEEAPDGFVLSRVLRLGFLKDGELEQVDFGFERSAVEDLISALQRGERDASQALRLLESTGARQFVIDSGATSNA